MSTHQKVYLGDGVYAAFEGYRLVLTVEDGVRVTDEIVLEPEVYTALTRFVEQLAAKGAGPADGR